MSTTDNNKRIAKNTLVLYVRMVLMTFIGLYTSRINLQALGVTDYGIMNVVGGLTSMSTLVTAAMASSIARFITFALGTGDLKRMKQVFSASVTIELMLSVIVVVLMETIGLWFLNNKLVIPAERMAAANWVFQFSIFGFVLGLIYAPYSACLVAHEKIATFAYIELFSAVVKLGIAFAVLYSPIDRLVLFSFLGLMWGVVLRFVYNGICKRNFQECVYRLQWDGKLMKEMFMFGLWSFVGCMAGILQGHGVNLMTNMFFGPALNAAKGVAATVNSHVTSFTHNLMVSVNPAITKAYAAGDRTYFMKLVYWGARMSFYLIFIVGLPVVLQTHYILDLWLTTVPEHTVLFIQLGLISAMFSRLSVPLDTAQSSTGNIRTYQLVYSAISLFCLPVCYVCYKAGCAPETSVVVGFVISQATIAAKLWLLRGLVGLSVRDFIRRVYLNILCVGAAACVLPLLLRPFVRETLVDFIWYTLLCVACACLAVLFIGCSPHERDMIRTYAVKMKGKLLHRGAC